MEPQKVIEIIREKYQPYPQGTIDHILENIDTYKPLLLNEIERATQFAKNLPYEDVGYISALYILSHIKEPQLAPLYIKLLQLPEADLDWLLGDMLTEDHFLYYCYDGNPEPLYALIRNKNVDEFAIWGVIEDLQAFVVDGRLEKDNLINFYQDLLDERPDLHGSSWGIIFQSISQLKFESLYTQSIELMRLNIIDNDFRAEMNEAIFNEYVNKEFGKEEILPYQVEIKDVHEELRLIYTEDLPVEEDDEHDEHDEHAECRWCKNDRHQDHEPLVSKKYPVNALCMCGSGKKYKKCCRG